MQLHRIEINPFPIRTYYVMDEIIDIGADHHHANYGNKALAKNLSTRPKTKKKRHASYYN